MNKWRWSGGHTKDWPAIVAAIELGGVLGKLVLMDNFFWARRVSKQAKTHNVQCVFQGRYPDGAYRVAWVEGGSWI